MAIFGSYIGKDRSLMGESVHVIVLDTFVAVIAGVIMFCACFTYGLEVNAGPSLLFDTMKARGLMKDSFHYYQAGYNEVGKDAAQNTAKYVLTEA